MMWKDHGELFQRCKKNPILTVEDWPYQAHSVFNPAATIVDGTTLLMVRVEDHRGFSHLTLAKSKNGIDGWKIDSEPTFSPDPVNYPEEIYGICLLYTSDAADEEDSVDLGGRRIIKKKKKKK